jgi:hypothetical protein
LTCRGATDSHKWPRSPFLYRNEFVVWCAGRGESSGIPHLAKNERDVGHPAVGAGIDPKRKSSIFCEEVLDV